ncbi:hypothetical protein ABT065_14375 [Streptomyces sp. NPDC002764]|uniref:hypothetical protein n=1 Tax=Streptomyces sp. NPDC002764 TaxID=3154428 RepID=UPI00332D31BF
MATTQISETGAPLEPVGVEGCATCTALAESRQIAREVDDLPAVAHCNVQIRNHPHRRSSDWRMVAEQRVWGVAL